MGFIIMEPEDTPPMSGSNSICVATVLLDSGILPMTEPETRLVLEAPGGLVEVVAQCRGGKAERITVRNVPSFADRLGAVLDVEGIGTLTVDTAYGGDSFVIVDAQALGFRIAPDEARELAEAGIRITRAANEQLGFTHPVNSEWNHISFCQIAAPVERRESVLTAANAVVVQPGKIDRSPTGTGASARMAVMHAKGEMQVGESYLASLDHRLGVPMPDRGGDSDRRSARHHSVDLRTCLDQRHAPGDARPERPLAERLPAVRYLATDRRVTGGCDRKHPRLARCQLPRSRSGHVRCADAAHFPELPCEFRAS
jgi:hypothetical protein